MDNPVLDKLFEYDNYRFFLKDYFQVQKELKESFSHRYFARRAGFSSSGFFHHVIEGKRGLTDKSMEKMIKGLSLRGRKATFFKNLVLFNQAKELEERERYFKVIDRIRKTSYIYKIKRKQFTYYEEWYHSIIRELVVSSNWKGNYAALGALVVPAISAEKAKSSVQLLENIGMIKKTTNGTYIQVQDAVTASDVPTVVTRKVRKDYLQLAEKAMEQLPLDERLISGVTVSMSRSRFNKIVAKLDEVRQMILADALEEDAQKQSVYQINFQAFPLSRETSFNNIKEEKND